MLSWILCMVFIQKVKTVRGMYISPNMVLLGHQKSGIVWSLVLRFSLDAKFLSVGHQVFIGIRVVKARKNGDMKITLSNRKLNLKKASKKVLPWLEYIILK